MKTITTLCTLGLVCGWIASVPAADQFLIDIDSTTIGGGNNSGPILTEPGWTSLDATGGNGSSVTVDGTTFSLFSADGTRVRLSAGLGNPNDLTGDFAFDDGAGQAVGLTIENLPAGVWEASVWAWDAGVPAGALDPMIVGWIEGALGSPENIVSTSILSDPVNAALTFQFPSDGASLYHIFTRENNDTDRTRLNALELTLVPEPGTLALGLVGLLGLLAGRCWRRR